jgi:predicted RNA methylase
MNSVLANIDQIRQSYSTQTTSQHKASLGQYFTPTEIAVFMASLFELKNKKQYKILDAGAGIGCLSSALLQKIQDTYPHSSCDVTAVELDKQLIATLQHNLQMFDQQNLKFVMKAL